MNVHLVDGTFELFRHHYARPRDTDDRGRQVGAVRGVAASLLRDWPRLCSELVARAHTWAATTA